MDPLNPQITTLVTLLFVNWLLFKWFYMRCHGPRVDYTDREMFRLNVIGSANVWLGLWNIFYVLEQFGSDSNRLLSALTFLLMAGFYGGLCWRTYFPLYYRIERYKNRNWRQQNPSSWHQEEHGDD